MLLRKQLARRNVPHPAPGPMYGAVDYGPGHRCNCDKHHSKTPCPHNRLPKIPSVHVSDTVKVTEIRDAFNNLRYKIVMSSIDGISNTALVDPKYSKYYEVEVVNCFSAPNPLVIAHKPEPTDEPITSLEKAQQDFDSYVAAYSNLVKAETKDFQDICAYKDDIGYEMTKPECCATCKWSRLAATGNDYVYGVTGRIECTNPKNALDYDFNSEQRGLTATKKTPPYFKERCKGKLNVYPNVHMFGKCTNYEEDGRDPYMPIQGDSIVDIIDRRTEAAYDELRDTIQQNITEEIDDQVNAAVDAATQDIGDQIQQNVQDNIQDAIEDQLHNGRLVIDGNSQIEDYNGDGTISQDETIIGGLGA